jgi:hypothetical protein
MSSECVLSASKPAWREAKFSTVFRVNRFCSSQAEDGQITDYAKIKEAEIKTEERNSATWLLWS